MEHEEGDGPIKLGPFKLDHQHERMLVIAGVGISALGLLLFLTSGRAKASTPIPSQGDIPSSVPGGGTAGGHGPEDVLLEELKLAGLQIEHSATFAFNLTSGANSEDKGSHTTAGSGSGGISLFGISIGGGGSKSGTDSWDLLTSEGFNAGLGGSNLSESEFDLLVQLAQATQNEARMAQDALYAAAADKLNRYKQQPAIAGSGGSSGLPPRPGYRPGYGGR